jgi:hypothetical protein
MQSLGAHSGGTVRVFHPIPIFTLQGLCGEAGHLNSSIPDKYSMPSRACQWPESAIDKKIAVYSALPAGKLRNETIRKGRPL